MDAEEHVPNGPFPMTILVTSCAWCFDPAVESATVMVGESRYEVDFCGRHVDELLQGARGAGGP